MNLTLPFKKKEKPNVYHMMTYQCEEAYIAIYNLIKLLITRKPEYGDAIEDCEKTADRKRRELIDYVRNSFITPVDRHDLFAVSRQIDDITDEIKDLKDFILFFDYQPSMSLEDMMTLIKEAITLLTEAVSSWAENQPEEEFWTRIVRIKKIENEMKRLYWESIKDMSQDKDYLELIRSVDFRKDLNSLANKIGRAADTLSDIKIKAIK